MDSPVSEPRYEGLTLKLLSPVGMVPMYWIAIGLQLINYGLNRRHDFLALFGAYWGSQTQSPSNNSYLYWGESQPAVVKVAARPVVPWRKTHPHQQTRLQGPSRPGLW